MRVRGSRALPFSGTCAVSHAPARPTKNLPKVPHLPRNPALYMRGRDHIYVRLRAENHVRSRGRDRSGWGGLGRRKNMMPSPEKAEGKTVSGMRMGAFCFVASVFGAGCEVWGLHFARFYVLSETLGKPMQSGTLPPSLPPWIPPSLPGSLSTLCSMKAIYSFRSSSREVRISWYQLFSLVYFSRGLPSPPKKNVTKGT